MLLVFALGTVVNARQARPLQAAYDRIATAYTKQDARMLGNEFLPDATFIDQDGNELQIGTILASTQAGWNRSHRLQVKFQFSQWETDTDMASVQVRAQITRWVGTSRVTSETTQRHDWAKIDGVWKIARVKFLAPEPEIGRLPAVIPDSVKVY